MDLIEFIYRKRLAGSLYDKFHKKGLPNPFGIEIESELPLICAFNASLFMPTEKTTTNDELYSRTAEYLLPEEVKLAETVYQLGFNYAKER